MLSLAKSFSRWDDHGTAVSLNFKGETRYGTLGGGCSSICLKLLALVFFCRQFLQVMTFEDPAISTYKILENRNLMDEPLSLGEHSTKVYFFFCDMLTAKFVTLEPRIGQFAL